MKNSLFDGVWPPAADDTDNGGIIAARDGFVIDDGGSLPSAAGGAATTTVSAAKPVASIATLADYLITGFWQYNATVAHFFPSSTISYNITGLNASEQFLAQTALQAWSEVANITFVQTSGAANITFTHNGTMLAYTTGNWPGGSITNQIVNISTDWVTTDGGANDGKTGIDSYAYQTYLHEIGHAIGLGHQGPYNGSASYSTDALYANDTWQYSLMSYFSEPNYSGSSYRYVVTPQMADIYAVGLMYGAATTTRVGNTVYGFNSNAGAVFSFGNYSPAPALTIYDSGGNDTLDCSGYSSVQTIDLHQGAFSSIGGLVNNIGIALGTVIEKAIGGSGSDTLIASDLSCTLSGAGGNDTLMGGAGTDTLIGGSGVDTMTGGGSGDTFVFLLGDTSAASGQHDRITDFASALDHIDLSGIDAISGTAGYDQFRFLATAGFDGIAGALNYFYNSALGVTTLQGDINGDGIADFSIDISGNVTISAADVIGAGAAVALESFGATTLTLYGGNYYLYANGTSTGPSLKYAGSPFVSGQFGAITPIAGEQTSGGYVVAWKVPGADQYVVWTTDANGNQIANVTGVVSGSSAVLQGYETAFHQDLNGDGTIGVAGTVIESFGSTSLVKVSSNYLLGSSGPTLKYAGAPFVAGQFGAITPIGAEQTSGGFVVAWKVPGADQYVVWTTDANGNQIANVTGVVSGSSSALQGYETTFQQDLNGDGTIGAAGTVIESFGSTSLVQMAGNFYLGSSGPTLKYGGSPFVAGQFGAITPIGAEQTSGGFVVAWKVPGADQYVVWTTDANGNQIANVTGVVSGSSSALQGYETTFHQDLNADGTIGVAGTVIESFGSTSLVKIGSNFYLGNSGPTLKYAGSPFVAGQFGAVTPIGTEQTSGGYVVAWKVPGADQYVVWTTDTNGNQIANVTGTVSGTSAALEGYEPTFHQDLNGDGTIGVPPGQAALGQATIAQDSAIVTGFGAGQTAFTFPSLSGSAASDHFAPLVDSVTSAALESPVVQNDAHPGLADSLHEAATTSPDWLAHLLSHQGDFHLV